jgi:cytochrome c oxidase assembly factor CtaG
MEATRAALLAAGVPPPLTPRAALVTWQFAPLVSVPLIVLAGLYLLCAARVRRRHPARPWPAGRVLAFFAGLTVIAVATQGSIGAYDDVLFSDHMVQHVLLIMVAPPLLVLGRPVTLLMHAARNPLHSRVKQAVRSRVITALTWPPGATAAYCLVVGGTHTPPFMDLVLANGTVHDAEHALYLVTGYLFFLPVAGSEPIRWRMSIAGRYLMLLAAMMVDSFTGIVFTFQAREVFAPYARTGRTWGPSLVTDLHAGGFVMLAGSDIAMTAVAVGLAVLFLRAGGQARDGAGGTSTYRGSALSRQMAAAGMPQPGGRADANDDTHLAAYNAYLRALSDGGEARDHRTVLGEHQDAGRITSYDDDFEYKFTIGKEPSHGQDHS